ncbi:pentapeptide repeat-containing protein [Thermogemmatispora carboxidivorans]|uniref:pentapeptide repeat-containing protein n=1 Tax=Thermogemmatispora carboxidivorans TaxID=1382306 RepID=UPI00069A51EB|nr:pentapeptide repeat-containing protein [Thermogemmatispora carboxidivorans]
MTRTLPDAVSRHLQDHERWLASSRTQGQRWQATGLDLSQLDLSGRPLQEAFLRSCSFAGSLLAHTNLSGAVLSSSHFLQAQAPDASLAQALCWQTLWRGAMLHRLQAERADFSEADFSEADLSEASLRLTRFDHARLRQTCLRQATLHQASFFGADLSGADLTGARLWRAVFSHASGLESVRVDWLDVGPPDQPEPLFGEAARRWLLQAPAHSCPPQLFDWLRAYEHWQQTDRRERSPILDQFDSKGLDLHGLDLSGHLLVEARLSSSNFDGALLRGCNLAEAWLASCSFNGATLDEARLVKAICWKALFRQASLRSLVGNGASFKLADLSQADLSQTDLSGADFHWACLQHACLRGAELRRTILARADLTGADLSGAHLWRTLLFGAIGLESVRADWLDVGPLDQPEPLFGEAAHRWLRWAASSPLPPGLEALQE